MKNHYRDDYIRKSPDEEKNSIVKCLEMWIYVDYNHRAVRIAVDDQHEPSISNNITIEYSGNNKLLFTINQELNGQLKTSRSNLALQQEIKDNLSLYEVLEEAEKLANNKLDTHKNLYVAENIFNFSIRSYQES